MFDAAEASEGKRYGINTRLQVDNLVEALLVRDGGPHFFDQGRAGALRPTLLAAWRRWCLLPTRLCRYPAPRRWPGIGSTITQRRPAAHTRIRFAMLNTPLRPTAALRVWHSNCLAGRKRRVSFSSNPFDSRVGPRNLDLRGGPICAGVPTRTDRRTAGGEHRHFSGTRFMLVNVP